MSSSQTTFSLKFPSSVAENLEKRAETLRKAEINLEFRANIIAQCARDPLFFINGYCWTQDPKKPDFAKIPFCTYEDFQDDAILKIVEAIETGEDLLIEKTREMGVSWMVLYVFVWYWLFKPNSNFRVGSRKEDFVDKIGVMDTLLEKVRFCVRNLPSWMRPVGYDESTHASYMRILNPENKNVIVGESANPHFGSGGRSKAILLDEYSKWDDSVADAAWTSTADVTRCRIPVSTPYGSGNKYAQLALGTKEKIKKLTLHWTLHPDKAAGAYYLDGEGKRIPISDHKTAFRIWDQNRQQKNAIIVRSPWYDAECERRSEADIAQELDIDYQKSGSPFFSISALKKQKEWTYFKRRNPFSRIPWGNYVTGKIIEHDHQVAFVESENDAWVEIYELPMVYMEYVYGGDTSEGQAKGDESFGVMRSKYTRNVVAVISGLIPNDDFELYSYLLCRFYNDAMAAVESYPSAYGLVVNKGLQKLGARMYFGSNATGKENENPGFETNAKTRPAMLDGAEEEVRRNSCEIRSGKIIKQMQTFIRNPKKGGRPEADGSMLDDGVIAFSIAGQTITEKPYNPRLTSGIIFNKTSNPHTNKKRRNNAGAGF